MNDVLGDRMKAYEREFTSQQLDRNLPVIIRLDGRAFHTFTRSLERPFDPNFQAVMATLARLLAVECNARIAYTQSDEITLVLLAEGDSQLYFDGKLFKVITALAGQASAQFNRLIQIAYERNHEVFRFDFRRLPTFDCRAFNVPSKIEAVNNLVWRQADCRRNSISAVAQYHFSHKKLQNKSTNDMLDMLEEIGVDWREDVSVRSRFGTFIQRRKEFRPFTATELDKLPAKHNARKNPSLQVERTDYVEVFRHLASHPVEHREKFVFDGK